MHNANGERKKDRKESTETGSLPPTGDTDFLLLKKTVLLSPPFNYPEFRAE